MGAGKGVELGLEFGGGEAQPLGFELEGVEDRGVGDVDAGLEGG